MRQRSLSRFRVSPVPGGVRGPLAGDALHFQHREVSWPTAMSGFHAWPAPDDTGGLLKGHADA